MLSFPAVVLHLQMLRKDQETKIELSVADKKTICLLVHCSARTSVSFSLFKASPEADFIDTGVCTYVDQ